MTRGYSDIYEKEYRRKDGTIFPVELRNYLIKDEKGQPAGIWAIVRDITERKRAEGALQMAHDELERRVGERTLELSKANARLQQTNHELQTIYDGMIEGLLVTDIETKRFVRVNPSMCRMLGYSVEELLAASVKDIHPPEELTNDMQRFQAAAEGRVSLNEDRPILRKDGSVFYADITGHRVFYNERPCLLGLFRDITERKKAAEALRESEEKYRVLVQACPDAVVMSDSEMRIAFASPQAVVLHGAASEEEMIGQSLTAFIAEEERPRATAGVSELVKSGVRRKSEYTFLRKDGTRYPCELSSGVVKSDSGQLKGIIAIVRDISAQNKPKKPCVRAKHVFAAISSRG